MALWLCRVAVSACGVLALALVTDRALGLTWALPTTILLAIVSAGVCGRPR